MIITSHCQHGSPSPSLATRLYHPSLQGVLQGCILYRHRAVVYRCELVVLPLLDHVKGFTGVYQFVLTYPAVSYVSGSSNLDSFRDGWKVAQHAVVCGVLPPGFVQYSSQLSCVVAVKFFLHKLS